MIDERGWFGESWGAPVCEPEMHCETPRNLVCLHCDHPIREGDQGIVMPFIAPGFALCATHLNCLLRSIRPCPGCDYCQKEPKS